MEYLDHHSTNLTQLRGSLKRDFQPKFLRLKHQNMGPRTSYNLYQVFFFFLGKICRLDGLVRHDSHESRRSKTKSYKQWTKPLFLPATSHHYNVEPSLIPDAPWCWYIYLHNWVILGVNVDQYSSTMEHMGIGWSTTDVN